MHWKQDRDASDRHSYVHSTGLPYHIESLSNRHIGKQFPTTKNSPVTWTAILMEEVHPQILM